MLGNKLVLGLGAATIGAFLVLAGFLIGSGWNRPAAQGESEPAPKDVVPDGQHPAPKPPRKPTPPPPPPIVKSEVRFRENLKEGRTYLATSKMRFAMNGTHRDWHVVRGNVGMIYVGTATAERKIERNDGHTLVEIRTFRETLSEFIEAPNLKSLNIELGPAGDILVAGAALFTPEALPAVTTGRTILEGVNFRGLAERAGIGRSIIDNLMNQNSNVRAMLSASSLRNKTVRLTQINDGVTPVQVDEVSGSLSLDERQFLASSVLPADSVIFPSIEVSKGETWQVPGSAFCGMLDPSLLARIDGNVTLRRASADRIELGSKSRVIPVQIVSGYLSFMESTVGEEKIGHFRPESGELLFDRDASIFVKGQMRGRGRISIKSKDHVLFEASSDLEPEITLTYICQQLGAP